MLSLDGNSVTSLLNANGGRTAGACCDRHGDFDMHQRFMWYADLLTIIVGGVACAAYRTTPLSSLIGTK